MLKQKECNLYIKFFVLCAYLSNVSRWISFTRRGVRIYAHRDPFSFWLWRDTTNKLRQDELLVEKLLFPGDVCVDAGANIGLLSLRAWKSVGPSGRVYSFEPHPKTYSRLIRNLTLNTYPTKYALQVGVGEVKTQALFSDLFISDINSVDSGGEIFVNLEKLDTLIPAGTKIKLLKVDVEGYELFALKGARETLAHTENILIELAPRSFEKNGYRTRDVIDLIEELGYEAYAIERGGVRTKVDSSFVPKDKYQDLLCVKRA